jgi:hypothetical protein
MTTSAISTQLKAYRLLLGLHLPTGMTTGQDIGVSGIAVLAEQLNLQAILVSQNKVAK